MIVATIRIETIDGVHEFRHVTRIWNDQVQGDRLNALELMSQGHVEITYDGNRKALIDCNSIRSITFAVPS